MPESDDGFLSEPFDNVINTVRSKYVAQRTLLLRTNRFAVAIQHALVIHHGNNLEFYAAVLFARTLATVQGAALLLERGLVAQARTLLRMALETLFKLGAIANKPTLMDELIEGVAFERKRLAKNMQLWKDPELRKVADAEAASGRLQPFLDSPASGVTTFALAEAAGLEDWYRSLYMLLSWPAHGAPKDLDRHVVVDSNQNLMGFQNEPELEKQYSSWFYSIEILLRALTALGKIFPNVHEGQIEHYHVELRALVQEQEGKL